MTVKSLEGTNVGKALRDTEGKLSGDLRRVEKRARGGDRDALKRLNEILDRSQGPLKNATSCCMGSGASVMANPGYVPSAGKPRTVEFRPQLPWLRLSPLVLDTTALARMRAFCWWASATT